MNPDSLLASVMSRALGAFTSVVLSASTAHSHGAQEQGAPERVPASSSGSSTQPLTGLSLDARYVNDDQGEVDGADILDGSLTGADVSTSGGDVTFGGGAVLMARKGVFGELSSAGGHDATVSGGRLNAADGAYATVGGGLMNHAAYFPIGNSAPTIAGGTLNYASGFWSTVGGGIGNTASFYWATVGGGEYNTAEGGASTVAGGSRNVAQGAWATIGGGTANHAADPIPIVGPASTIAGGNGNSATNGGTIGGGTYNSADHRSSIAGGSSNTASGDSSSVPGGYRNAALGDYSFAAGRRARAEHDGAFVWGDSVDVDKASSGPDEFNVYASGGTRIFSNAGGTSGVLLAPGGGSWTSVSDRDAKENLRPVDGREVLERLAAVPISTWNYRAQDDAIRHMGPMAQDFWAAFELGLGDTGIDTIDPDGVALAAIQGLHALVSEQQERNEALRLELRGQQQQVEALRAEIAALKVSLAGRAAR